MRDAVTVGTFGYHFVFLLMAADAEELSMLRLAGNQQAVSFCMTGAAELIGSVVLVGNVLRHVSLMAATTVTDRYVFRMVGAVCTARRFVAVGAFRNLAMFVMAE